MTNAANKDVLGDLLHAGSDIDRVSVTKCVDRYYRTCVNVQVWNIWWTMSALCII